MPAISFKGLVTSKLNFQSFNFHHLKTGRIENWFNYFSQFIVRNCAQMDSPYLPVMIEECPKIADVQVSSWPSGKVRLVGTLHRKPYELAKDDVFLNVQQLEAQLIRPPKRPERTHFLPSDEIYLKSVTSSGEHKLILDFR